MKNLPLHLLSRILDKISNFYWFVTYWGFRRKYELDKKFRFNGKSILFYGNGCISAGPESYIGELSTLQAVEGCSINIGTGCKISHNVRVYTQSDIADYDFSLGDPPKKYGNVIFYDYCWVGANVFISPGVNIGSNAIVGANSVVTKDIPSFEIWGGVPAKFIRRKKIP
jgi:maltose O-acetyltransferase